MTNSTMHDQADKKNKSLLVGPLGWAIAAAFGAAIGLLLAPKPGAELQEDVRKKAQELADKFKKTKEEVQKTIQDAFGELTAEEEEELSKNYLELRGEILAKVDEMKERGEELSQKIYNKIVRDTVTTFAKGKKWAQDATDKLAKELEKDWEELKRA